MPRIANFRPNAGENINGFAFQHDAKLDAMVSVDDIPADAAANFLLLEDIHTLAEDGSVVPKADAPVMPEGVVSTSTEPSQPITGSVPASDDDKKTEGGAHDESEKAPAAPAGDAKKSHAKRPTASQIAKP